jgi:predicted nucleic acid-binding protein
VRSELARDDHWAAPAHLQVEVFAALRGLNLGGKLSEGRARLALDALRDIIVEAVPLRALMPRMWQLRRNVGGYDAAYVAAAEAHQCPLVTADARLTRVRGLHCEIRLASPER